MHWILADLLMFLFSVVLFLAVRKSSLEKLPSQFNNLAMFAVPLIIFLSASIVIRPSFELTFWQFVCILGTGVILAYIGNALSIKSIGLAPNAGYSLILSKSYVVLTAVLAVFLFGAPLTVTAVVSILLILASSGLIMIHPRQARYKTSNRWVYMAIGAFFCWAFLSVMAKYLVSLGVPTLVFLVYIFAIVCICVIVEMLYKRVDFHVVKRRARPFILIGLASTGFNFFNFYALSISPNLGYVNATNAASIGAVTLLSVWFFKDELTKRKLLGVSGVISGLFLLLIWP